MQVKGMIEAVKTRESRFPETFLVGIKVKDQWFNILTKFPDNFRQGEEISFNCVEVEKNGKVFNNVDFKSIKKIKSVAPNSHTGAGSAGTPDSPTGSTSISSNDLKFLLDRVLRKLDDQTQILVNLKTLVLDSKNEVSSDGPSANSELPDEELVF